MASYLFFDDQRLLAREGMERRMGKPSLLEDTLFREKKANAMGPGCRLWQDENGKWHMFYHVYLQNEKGECSGVICAAISQDGLHFQPRNTAKIAGIQDALFENQLLPGKGMEVLSFVDTKNPPGRLKLLVVESGDLCVYSWIYESDDAIHWKKSAYKWHDIGAEGIGSVLFNKQAEEYVLLVRPMWGVRRVSISQTKNFSHFSSPLPLLQADAEDQPLSETYGLVGVAYKDFYIGLLQMYHPRSADTWKYWGGTMEVQLAYSFDALHWQRCLHHPVIRNETPFHGMVFATDMRTEDDGDILLYTTGYTMEHGEAFLNDPSSAIAIYKLREDGFVSLHAEAEGRIRTRETCIMGPFDINLQAKKATCALFTASGEVIAGFSHDECEPFSGDNKHWVPQFYGKIDSLKGKVVAIEIKIVQGEIYAIQGDFIKLMNTENWRYDRFGLLPQPSEL